MITLTDAFAMTTRSITPEGFLQGRAVVMQVGALEYDAAELGVGPKGTRIKLMRDEDSVFHVDTLASLRRAPITMVHPEKGVTKDNWRTTIVGNVIGEPFRSGEQLLVDIIVRDQDAIKSIDDGQDDSSVGYSALVKQLEDADRGYRSEGGLHINHLAVVKYGRSGPNVRVLDEAKETGMTTEELKAITDAITEAVRGTKTTSEEQAKVIGDAISAAIAPVLKDSEDRRKLVDEADAEAKRKEAETKATEAADALVTATLADERVRVAGIQDAMTLIPEARHAEVKDMPLKDVLVIAVGDSVTNAANQSDEYLRGIIAEQAKTRRMVPGANKTTQVNANDAETAHATYRKFLAEAWQPATK